MTPSDLIHRAEAASRELRDLMIGAGDDSYEHKLVNRAATLIDQLAAAIPEWQSMDSAPKDGTHILIWFVHDMHKYVKETRNEDWNAVHEAHWIEHNGGGWTWYGLLGAATKWMPLPPPPASEGK